MPFWAARQLLCVGRLPVGGFLILEIVRAPFFILGVTDEWWPRSHPYGSLT
jgi:hypothetical protein